MAVPMTVDDTGDEVEGVTMPDRPGSAPSPVSWNFVPPGPFIRGRIVNQDSVDRGFMGIGTGHGADEEDPALPGHRLEVMNLDRGRGAGGPSGGCRVKDIDGLNPPAPQQMESIPARDEGRLMAGMGFAGAVNDLPFLSRFGPCGRRWSQGCEKEEAEPKPCSRKREVRQVVEMQRADELRGIPEGILSE